MSSFTDTVVTWANKEHFRGVKVVRYGMKGNKGKQNFLWNALKILIQCKVGTFTKLIIQTK